MRRYVEVAPLVVAGLFVAAVDTEAQQQASRPGWDMIMLGFLA